MECDKEWRLGLMFLRLYRTIQFYSYIILSDSTEKLIIIAIIIISRTIFDDIE